MALAALVCARPPRGLLHPRAPPPPPPEDRPAAARDRRLRDDRRRPAARAQGLRGRRARGPLHAQRAADPAHAQAQRQPPARGGRGAGHELPGHPQGDPARAEPARAAPQARAGHAGALVARARQQCDLGSEAAPPAPRGRARLGGLERAAPGMVLGRRHPPAPCRGEGLRAPPAPGLPTSGPGAGYLPRHVAEFRDAGYEAWGVDQDFVSHAEGEVADEQFLRRTVPPEYRLPFDDGEFDFRLLHIGHGARDEPQRALHEIRRVLRPGGLSRARLPGSLAADRAASTCRSEAGPELLGVAAVGSARRAERVPGRDVRARSGARQRPVLQDRGSATPPRTVRLLARPMLPERVRWDDRPSSASRPVSRLSRLFAPLLGSQAPGASTADSTRACSSCTAERAILDRLPDASQHVAEPSRSQSRHVPPSRSPPPRQAQARVHDTPRRDLAGQPHRHLQRRGRLAHDFPRPPRRTRTATRTTRTTRTTQCRQTWAIRFRRALTVPTCGQPADGSADPCASLAGLRGATGATSMIGRVDHKHVDGIYRQFDRTVKCRLRKTTSTKKRLETAIAVRYIPGLQSIAVTAGNPLFTTLSLSPRRRARPRATASTASSTSTQRPASASPTATGPTAGSPRRRS